MTSTRKIGSKHISETAMSTPTQPASGSQFSGHVGQFELYGLEIGDRSAKGLALAGIGFGGFIGGPGQPQ